MMHIYQMIHPFTWSQKPNSKFIFINLKASVNAWFHKMPCISLISGFIPDIGSMMALVASSTGRNPDVIVGKPHSPIVETIIEKTGFTSGEIMMVGDRLYTDIALGKSGLSTTLVLSGEAKLEDVEQAPHKPDLIVQDIAELHLRYLDAIGSS